MGELSKLSYDEIRQQWDSLNKESLLLSGRDLPMDIIHKLFSEETLECSLIWSTIKITEEIAERYAETPEAWMFVSARCKMSPQFMARHKSRIHFDYVYYTDYTVDELLQTEHVYFPIQRLGHLSLADKLRLFRAEKLTGNPHGGYDTMDYYWGRAYPLWRAFDLLPKKATFEDVKLVISQVGLANYNGKFIFNYDHLLEIHSELPEVLNEYTLTFLLNQRKLDVTNEEWDAIIALIHLK